ncbi:thiamine phosphate synthase [Meridianimarinicoccus aquatilis]|uniref:Thiamine phosphate synthase n=1 Tax=Meridianimarinicoccus aquatilis TaxID=2552766 RepID=A0A4R6B5I5_9RHOB|nr:thiamine phosphate synthase [Fluviibacterium aquatile]TDL91216.1 thiamine phosphate synthase [Fluviibacterium aquatile]
MTQTPDTDEKMRPQLYLLTPSDPTAQTFPDLLAAVLDAVEIACLRLRMASTVEDDIARVADRLRPIAHARDIPLVIDTHLALVDRLGLDGVHLTDGAKSVRKTRKDLGQDAIVGAFCGGSRHDGLAAGEAGADYIAFGPVGDTILGTGDRPEQDLFAWWSEVIELPVVAEGALTDALIRTYAPMTDFFALGDEIWRADDPVATIKSLDAAID